jgi:hypothetical protein
MTEPATAAYGVRYKDGAVVPATNLEQAERVATNVGGEVVMLPATALRTRTEYGLRINCNKQGCNPRHADDGDVIARQRLEDINPRHVVSGHAADLVKRTITISEWIATND